MWFISQWVTYFFVFVVTLVAGAMVTLLVSERLGKKARGGGGAGARPNAKPTSKRKPKKRRRR